MRNTVALPLVVLGFFGVWLLGPGTEAAPLPADEETDRVRPPFVRVIGSVQDGGFPHAACDGDACRGARSAGSKRYVASLALVLPDTGQVYLFDATPDIREQLDLLRDVRAPLADGVDRQPVDGIFLSHAHMGHYLGLAFFGYEAVHTKSMPLYCTPRMASFLRGNGPWSQLTGKGNVAIEEITPGESVELAAGVTVTMVPSPHREEFSDTVGFLIRGPSKALLFVPDTDAWNRWAPPIEDWLRRVDVALLDGTFYSRRELPNRSIEQIGHPLVTQSLDRLESLLADGPQILFTHMNHSNPILLEDSAEADTVARRGFAIAREGMEFDL